MPPDILVMAPPASRRVRAFQATLAERGWPVARVVSYLDYMTGGVSLPALVRPGTIVRLESPGEDFATEQALLRAGDLVDPEADYERLSQAEVRQLLEEPGRLLPSRQWFLGFNAVLQRLAQDLLACPRHQLCSHPGAIAVMCDKRATHARLALAGVPVPPCLPPVMDGDALLAAMQERCWSRVFVKLAHGSSAAGAVALETNGRQWLATTTVEVVRTHGTLRLYNSRRLLRYHTLQDIRILLNALCRQRVHVERWLPKADFAGRICDLRVVVIGGKAQHVVVRLARGPMTNLHLRNERGDWPALQERLGMPTWEAVQTTCEAALRCFPQSLYGGVDVLLTPHFRRHAVLEVNAFGDYHRGVLVQGLDTYAAELQALGVPLC